MGPHSTVVFHLALFWVVSVYSETVHLHRYVLRRDNYRIKDEIRFGQEMTCSSLIAGVAYCAKTDDCQTVSFNIEEQRCRLSKVDVSIHTMVLPGKIIFDLQEEAGWITISKAIFTVYLLKFPGDSYESAANACLERHTIVASLNDLLQSRSLGYVKCACGWLSNGTKGYISQPNPDFCSDETLCENGICVCPTAPAVYCVL